MTTELIPTRLTEKQIMKVIEQYNKNNGCIVYEVINPMIAQADIIAANVTKMSLVTNDMWDIMCLTGTYKYARDQVRVKPSQQQSFDFIFYVEEMIIEWDEIKEDPEVLELLEKIKV